MDVLQIVIQGGAVGLAVYALYVLDKVSSAKDKIIGNHIDHSTEAMTQLTKVLEGLRSTIESRGKQRRHRNQ